MLLEWNPSLTSKTVAVGVMVVLLALVFLSSYILTPSVISLASTSRLIPCNNSYMTHSSRVATLAMCSQTSADSCPIMI